MNEVFFMKNLTRLVFTIGVMLVASTSLSQAQNNASILGDLAKDEKGNVKTMNQYQAAEYCQSIGSRLPTVRELALYAQSLGADGISDRKEDDDYGTIYTRDIDGNIVVDFYFSFRRYHRPGGDLEDYWYWSSSVHPKYPDEAYLLSGYVGVITYDSRYHDHDYAVRCVK